MSVRCCVFPALAAAVLRGSKPPVAVPSPSPESQLLPSPRDAIAIANGCGEVEASRRLIAAWCQEQALEWETTASRLREEETSIEAELDQLFAGTVTGNEKVARLRKALEQARVSATTARALDAKAARTMHHQEATLRENVQSIGAAISFLGGYGGPPTADGGSQEKAVTSLSHTRETFEGDLADLQRRESTDVVKRHAVLAAMDSFGTDLCQDFTQTQMALARGQARTGELHALQSVYETFRNVTRHARLASKSLCRSSEAGGEGRQQECASAILAFDTRESRRAASLSAVQRDDARQRTATRTGTGVSGGLHEVPKPGYRDHFRDIASRAQSQFLKAMDSLPQATERLLTSLDRLRQLAVAAQAREQVSSATADASILPAITELRKGSEGELSRLLLLQQSVESALGPAVIFARLASEDSFWSDHIDTHVSAVLEIPAGCSQWCSSPKQLGATLASPSGEQPLHAEIVGDSGTVASSGLVRKA